MNSDELTTTSPSPEPTPTPEPATPVVESVATVAEPAVPTPELPNTPPADVVPTTESAPTPETVPTAEVIAPSPEEATSTATEDAALPAEAPAPVVPALPPQPVPQVPKAPQSHDLSRIAQDLQIRKAQVEAVIQLIDDGNTIPFITRYRKERTGGLDEVQLRRIQERITTLRDLASRKQTILRSIANQGRLNDDLVAAILEAEFPARLEDLYLPYKPKKRSLATDARERGLGPLADAIWARDPAVENLQEVLPGMVDPWKQLHEVTDVITGVRHILAEIIADHAAVRGPVRMFLWDTAVITSTRNETTTEAKGREYKDYFNFKEPIRFIPPHRTLAINRGEREQILRLKLGWEQSIVREIVLNNLPLADHPHRDFILPAIEDAIDRLLMPSLEREIRRELTERAQDHAIGIFARNLRSLLLRPPLGGKRVLAIDPGIRTGCKVAVLDETGTLLEESVVYPHQPQKKVAEAKLKLEQLIRKYQTPIIAIGNGTACRETEQIVSEIIADFENRRLNPAPAASPIEPVTTDTATQPTHPEPIAVPTEPESTPPAAETLPMESVTAGVLPADGGVIESPMIAVDALAGETATVSSPDAGVADGVPTVVQSPTLDTPATPVPQPSPPPISLEGLPLPPEELAYVIVIESGASDYSASPVAKEEFPNLDATARGTISIGRRLQDPLAELVKIDPQHIGVGLYQHDVKAKHLKESLDKVVESCVNTVGVDLNTASVPLLRHVSGLNQLVARELVEYRKQHGPFTHREQLKSVPQMGEARFTQAAGFLKIRGGDHPLDGTWVHPESYPLAEKILAEAGLTPTDIREKAKLAELRQKLNTFNLDEFAAKFETGPMTIRDIFDALARPDRDPREDRPQPIFRKGVLKIEDLKPGMELKGEVLNVVDFGAFVDVGLKDSGLVHISQMANRYIKSPYDVIAVGDVVPVWVITVDVDMGRVSLTMIHPGQERRGPGGPPRGERAPRGDRPPRGERPPQGDRPPRGERPPQGDRPQREPRPEHAGGPRPAGGPGGSRPAGPGARPAATGGNRPGGNRPRGPGAPGWRSSPKPATATPTVTPANAAESSSPPPVVKKPAKPKATPKLNDQQKTGKEPVYSFAQLAALLTKPKVEPRAPEAATEVAAPAGESTGNPPVAGATATPAAETPPKSAE
ncbi:MAG: helix-hairpin-helix domain-containing protein [Bacteroidales bacterium]|nr:helix-hairpin-helix domain-containing protein [Bacteroidales bacterium]